MALTLVGALVSSFVVPVPPHVAPRAVAPRLVPSVSFSVSRNAPHLTMQAPSGVDWAHVGKYPLATVGEFMLIAALLKGIDLLPFTLPTFMVPPLFAFLSLRSRIFSLLPASRPPRGGFDNPDGERKAPVPIEVKRPSWTPPGIAFPFIWLTISCLRAASSTLIWRACGKVLFSPPLLVLVAHLCIGDTWNCVTNVEKRLGTSAVGVIAVLASVYTAVAVYAKTLPLAGALLAPSALWISIASVLTWTIWNMNTPKQSLLPQKGDTWVKVDLRVPLSSPMEN